MHFYEDTLANARDIEMALKRALYWTEDPETASHIAAAMSGVARIRRDTLRERARRKELRNGDGR